MSLRLHLILLVVVCMLPAMALLATSQMELRQARETEVRREILELAQSDAGEVARAIEGGKQLLTALEQVPAIRERNGPLCSALLSRLKQEYPSYAGFVATDPSGRSFCGSTPGRAVYESDQPYFRAALDTGGFVVGSYRLSPLVGAPVLPMARPVYATDGSMLGVLVLWLDLDQLARELGTKLPRGATLTLVDRDGTVMLRAPSGDITAGSALPQAWLAATQVGTPTTIDAPGSNRAIALVAAAPVGDAAYGLQVLAARDKQAAFAALDATTRNGIILITGSLVVALLLAGLIAWRFIQVPIRELLHTAERLRRGEYAHRTRLTTTRSELGRMGQALNALAFALAEREADRNVAENQLLEFAATLEQRVEELTQELAATNAQLAAEAVQRQTAQAALAQAQKLDAIGQLTGGVAHDFNNLLAAIIGAIEVALRRTEDTRTKRLLMIAMQAAERGAKLTAHLLAFSRKQELVLQAVNVNEVITGMSDMLRRTIGPMIRLQHDLAADLWPASADPVQLEVALLNLAVNARDAMPEGGELVFRTRNVLGAQQGGDHAALPPGEYAMVTVSDTGPGMPPEVQARAFEPFFTTKGVGKGTGLGLSMVYGFATQTGGTATIDSHEGKGTAISLYLPVAAAQPVTPEVPSEATTRAPSLRILLVDDDAGVRAAAQEMLRELGHDVTQAENGMIALEVLRGREEFDLVLVDFAMPEMTGVQFAEAASGLRPGLAVLLMTGYAESDARQSWTERGCRTVMKPFNSTELAAALRDAIGSPETAPPH